MTFEAHLVENVSQAEMISFVIANMPVNDDTTYPTIGRIFIKPERKLVGEISDGYDDRHE
jgi:hypothetical protein